jgi:hypothetical protein
VAKRVFVSFAKEDSTYRDFLVGQARNEKSPFEFVDVSVKEAWDEQWKTNCRTKIRGSDGVIALLSSNTSKADGARWEMKCAVEEKVPILGVYVDKNNKPGIPQELSGKKVIEWSWPGIAAFIEGL